MASNSTTLYEILGISPIASTFTIRAAYRRLAKEHHPDKGGDPDRFAQINNAHAILSDEAKRAAYDRTGQAPTSAAAPPSQATLDQVRMMQMISQKFTEAMQAQKEPEFESVIADTIRALRAARDLIDQHVDTINIGMRNDLAALRRLQAKNPTNDFLGTMLRDRRAKGQAFIRENLRNAALMSQAAKWVGRDYGWKIEERPLPEPLRQEVFTGIDLGRGWQTPYFPTSRKSQPIFSFQP